MITFLRFSRAHTVIGTTVSLLVLYVLAVRHTGQADWGMFLFSLFSCLCANVYITGLNQLTDVEIDRINKPYLPLASGAYSLRTGRWIVIVAGVLAFLTSFAYPPWLTETVIISLVIGTAYSLPPVRLKRFHFWAAFCIIAVRGFFVNVLLYLHFSTQLGGPARLHASVWMLTFIMLAFGTVIAWFKDLPDTEGDAAHDIQTLSLVKDRQWVFWVGTTFLTVVFLTLIWLAWYRGNTGLWLGQSLVAGLFLWLGRRLDLSDQASIARFYQGVWGLFFGEYLLFGVFG